MSFILLNASLAEMTWHTVCTKKHMLFTWVVADCLLLVWPVYQCHDVAQLAANSFLYQPRKMHSHHLMHVFIQDYMQNVHGKEIDLLGTTVKFPGKRPPRAIPSSPSINAIPSGICVPPTSSPKANGLSREFGGLNLSGGIIDQMDYSNSFTIWLL